MASPIFTRMYQGAAGGGAGGMAGGGPPQGRAGPGGERGAAQCSCLALPLLSRNQHCSSSAGWPLSLRVAGLLICCHALGCCRHAGHGRHGRRGAPGRPHRGGGGLSKREREREKERGTAVVGWSPYRECFSRSESRGV